MQKSSILITVLFVLIACREPSSGTVVLPSRIEWQKLNPARGDKSPQAGTIWGDRSGTGPTGFLFKPVDGFRSPPHIHNVSYRGVVISGVVHNDDPQAADMWMPAGSFWTQPKGEVHITAARGDDTLAYIEIEAGPYLVRPPSKAFDSGERPVNVHASNIVWVPQSGTFGSSGSPELAFLWGHQGQGKLRGYLLKLPAGFSGTIAVRGTTFRAVVIKGQPVHKQSRKTLVPGSYFSSRGKSAHGISSNNETILYIRTDSVLKLY